MSGEDIALITLAETTKEHVTKVHTDKVPLLHEKNDGRLKGSLIHRLQKLRFRIPTMTKFRNRLKKMNCFKTEEDEIMMMEMPRHKSIDIGVGFARRMSLFLFTKRSSCVHPYHPYTPAQTTRKFFMMNDD